MTFLRPKSLLLGFLVLGAGCTQKSPEEKIGFDLAILHDNGLYGPVGGLRSLDYEFCVPISRDERRRVKEIDPSLTCTLEQEGRLDCSPDEITCFGNTHQKSHTAILIQLAQLPYIERIEQTFHE